MKNVDINSYDDLEGIILDKRFTDKQISTVIKKAVRIYIFTPIKDRKQLAIDLRETFEDFEDNEEFPLFTLKDSPRIMK